jgi:GcrA cell cycle regulator
MNMQVRQHHAVDVVKASELWKDGLSAAKIAAQFDVSRGVIIGLAHRQRNLFPERRERVNPLSAATKKKTTLAQELLGPEEIDIKPTEYDEARKSLAKGLVDLKSDECRFPLDNGHPFMFCAASTHKASAYCSHHHFRAYRKKDAA